VSVLGYAGGICFYVWEQETLGKLDVNQATVAELSEIPGMLGFTARLIIARRPYRRSSDLLGVSGMTPGVPNRLSTT